MYCRNCRYKLVDEAEVCGYCGTAPMMGRRFCFSCGSNTEPGDKICNRCGIELPGGGFIEKEKKNPEMILLCLVGVGVLLFALIILFVLFG